MAQSQNTRVDHVTPASYFSGLSTYGNIMMGDRALEFYNDRNPEDYVQIPWGEIDHVAASVMFGGRIIPRWAVFTRDGRHFSFSARNNHATLRAIRDHVGGDKIVRSATFLGVVRAGLVGLWHRLARRG